MPDHERDLAWQAAELVRQGQRIAELEAALRAIVDASNSEAASGGEIFWCETVGPFVDQAETLLS